MHDPISPAALAAVPLPARGQRCICPACAHPSERPPVGDSAKAGTAL